MSLSVSTIANFRKRKPLNLIVKELYVIPSLPSVRWGLLAGPYYGDKEFTGSLLLDLSLLSTWASHHAKSTWSSKTSEQQAKVYFPKWLGLIEIDADYIVLLDRDQRVFLRSYALDFIRQGFLKIYCPACQALFKSIIENNHSKGGEGKVVKWTEEWQCPRGHILHYEKNEIKIF